MPKRTNTHIYKYATKTGKQFYGFKIYLGINPLTGKKVERTRGRFDSYAAADREYKAMAAAGIQPEYDDNMTMAELHELWFAVRKERLKPASQHLHDGVWRNHIDPTLGKYRIGKLTPQVLQDWVNGLPAKLVAFQVPINIVKSMLKYAKRKGIIADNTMDRVDIPTKTKRDRRDTSTNFYSRDELKEFLRAAKKTNLWTYMYVSLLATSGMRMSEALALRWDDIDIDAMTISVTKTVTTDRKGHQTLGPTKNLVTRTIPLNQQLLPLLREHQLASVPGPYLFGTPSKPDQPIDRSVAQRQFSHIYDHTDLRPITLHGLRHTFATIVFEDNPDVTPKDMQSLLGDQTMDVVMQIYVHVSDEGRRRSVDAVNGIKIL